MEPIRFPYGKEFLEYTPERECAVLTSSVEEYVPEERGEALVLEALKKPVESPGLSELAVGKKKVVLIASDHTRPVPSRIIVPAMLAEIRRGNPEAQITILIATGCHRGTTPEELEAKFGEAIVKKEKIVVHDCDDEEMLVELGTLPSGGKCIVNRLAVEADLLVAEGFIEPHFFAGFSGGRKSVLPGIAGRKTVLANHCAEFIADENARTGVLENNPVHRDMLWAAEKAGLAFIVNVVLNGEKEAIFATAGHPVHAHKAGTDFLASLCQVKTPPTDVVISTNGGYPLDQNLYQAVKGMTAAEGAVKEGGVIIMLARSDDGIGGEHFYKQLSRGKTPEELLEEFLARHRDETEPDQWQSQIFARVLARARVIYLSELDDETVRAMNMIPAHSIPEALSLAASLLGKADYSLTVIPDGVAVIMVSAS
ncbi:MAG: nickel-dependent lactate racemase [Ruminococcaceae bacterium]|nr:nickel-dependent lactate racemase [Oscillospiraceae bacterium]